MPCLIDRMLFLLEQMDCAHASFCTLIRDENTFLIFPPSPQFGHQFHYSLDWSIPILHGGTRSNTRGSASTSLYLFCANNPTMHAIFAYPTLMKTLFWFLAHRSLFGNAQLFHCSLDRSIPILLGGTQSNTRGFASTSTFSARTMPPYKCFNCGNISRTKTSFTFLRMALCRWNCRISKFFKAKKSSKCEIASSMSTFVVFRFVCAYDRALP